MGGWESETLSGPKGPIFLNVNKKHGEDIARMDPKYMAALITGSVVCVVVFSALLIPIVGEATTTEKTFTNEGYYTMDKISTDAEFVFTWDYTEPKKIDIDGVKIDFTDAGLSSGKSYTVFGSDKFVIRLTWEALPYCQCFTPAAFYQASTTTSSVFTATVSNGEITVVSTDPSYTTPTTMELTDKAYCINPNGDGAFVMKKDVESVYIETNTDIIVLDGITALADSSVGIYAEGTLNDGLDAIAFRGTGTYAVTFDDFTYTTTDVSGYVDLVKLEKVQFVATQNDTDYDVTYSYFIVPTEVTAELTVHPDAATLALLSVLPIIAMIGIILAVVGAFVVSRNDY